MSRTVDRERIRQRLVRLVGVPSITGDEQAAVDLVAGWLRDCADEVDRWTDSMSSLARAEDYPGKEVEREAVPVVAARVKGARPGPTVLLTGHLDVVPAGDRETWDSDPFAAVVDGDRVIGRGACDMKSGIVAALEVAELLARGDRDFAGELVFVAVPGEEDGGSGTFAAIRRGWRADAAILPEPTRHQGVPRLVVAHAGALTFTVTVPGRSAHASKRLEGECALEHYTAVHQAMRQEERRINAAETHPLMRALGLPYATSVGRIGGGDWAASVMGSLQVEVRVGVALGESVRQAEERFRQTISEAARSDPWLAEHPPRVQLTGGRYASAELARDHPLVATVSDAARQVFGRRPELAAAPYGCDMAQWIRLADTPTVVYGPGDVSVAHAPNEWVSLDETVDVARVLLLAVLDLLGDQGLGGGPESRGG